MVNKFCDLIKKFSPEFIKMIDDTKTDGKERGVNFCTTNGNIELSDICIGEKCKIPIEIQKECKEKKNAIGNIHTHPGLGIIHGEISGDDVMYAIANSLKYSCIGYRGIAKTIDCYESPFGIPQVEADKFKNINIMVREKGLRNDLQKYGINILGRHIPKTDTSKEQWNKLKEYANYLTELKNNFRKHINKPEAEEERLKNSCTIFLAPLDEEYLD